MFGTWKRMKADILTLLVGYGLRVCEVLGTASDSRVSTVKFGLLQMLDGISSLW